MEINLKTQRGIVDLYKAGGFDSEAIAYLCSQHEGFRPSTWKRWMAEDVEFREFIEDSRVLARAAWEKMLRESVMEGKQIQLPAWMAAARANDWAGYEDKPAPTVQINQRLSIDNERVQAVIDNLMARMSAVPAPILSTESGENTRVVDIEPE